MLNFSSKNAKKQATDARVMWKQMTGIRMDINPYPVNVENMVTSL
jgi:hypothetical protein